MSIEEPLTYFEDHYNPNNYIMDRESYSMALDNIVVACIDVAVTYKGNLLIGKRIYHPQKSWWLIGGRMKTGETARFTASRHVIETIGLRLGQNDLKRYRYLLNFYGAWNKRAHPPISNGTHTHSSIYNLELSEKECQSLVLVSEFSQIKWVKINEVSNSNFHPVIRAVAQKLTDIQSINKTT